MNQYKIMSSQPQVLELFAGVCGLTGGVINMLSSTPLINASIVGSTLIAFVLGGAGYLGGKVAGELLKYLKIQWKKIKQPKNK